MILDKPYVAYYRVSTQKQGESGLGLEGQMSAVREFLHRDPDYEFTEIETGTGKKRRFKMEEAIELCKEKDAILLIAKLDRLGRNVHFISGLKESGIDFVCCDNPRATPFWLNIMASIAEEEAKVISNRVKAAIRAKTDRERHMGNKTYKWGRSGFEARKPVSEERRIEVAKIKRGLLREARDDNKRNKTSFPLIDEMSLAGNSVGEIMRILNTSKVKPPRGKIWTRVQVKRVIDRDKRNSIEYSEGL